MKMPIVMHIKNDLASLTCLILMLNFCFLPTAHAETYSAVGDPWPPLMEISERQGIISQIATEALMLSGNDLDIELVPWSRALAMIQSQKKDLLIGAWYTEERNAYLRYSEPIYESEIAFVSHENKSFKYSGLESLRGLSVGTLPNYTYSPHFLAATHFNKVEAHDLVTNLKNVVNGRLDATLDDRFVLQHVIRQLPSASQSKLVIIDPTFIKKNIYIAANRDDPRSEELIGLINKGVLKLKRSGRYLEILNEYNLPQQSLKK